MPSIFNSSEPWEKRKQSFTKLWQLQEALQQLLPNKIKSKLKIAIDGFFYYTGSRGWICQQDFVKLWSSYWVGIVEGWKKNAAVH